MNNIFISYDHILFFQNLKNTNKHKHMMKHLTITMKGHMQCELNQNYVDTCGYILGENVMHERFGESSESMKMVFLLQPGSSLSKDADVILNGKDYLLLSEKQVEVICDIWNKNIRQKTSEEIKKTYNQIISEIFNICGLHRNRKNFLDKRIELVLDSIDKNDIIENYIIEDVINKVHLSKSRLFHLFKDNVGISFKNFLLMKKFIKTWSYLAEGKNITEACISGGFFDSAHYAHFMSECFGLSTKDELKIIDEIYLIDRF